MERENSVFGHRTARKRSSLSLLSHPCFLHNRLARRRGASAFRLLAMHTRAEKANCNAEVVSEREAKRPKRGPRRKLAAGDPVLTRITMPPPPGCWSHMKARLSIKGGEAAQGHKNGRVSVDCVCVPSLACTSCACPAGRPRAKTRQVARTIILSTTAKQRNTEYQNSINRSTPRGGLAREGCLRFTCETPSAAQRARRASPRTQSRIRPAQMGK